jgi:hypothetical protein
VPVLDSDLAATASGPGPVQLIEIRFIKFRYASGGEPAASNITRPRTSKGRSRAVTVCQWVVPSFKLLSRSFVLKKNKFTGRFNNLKLNTSHGGRASAY